MKGGVSMDARDVNFSLYFSEVFVEGDGTPFIINK